MADKSAIDSAIDAYLRKKGGIASSLNAEIKLKGANHDVFHDSQVNSQAKRKLMRENNVSYQELKAAREKRKYLAEEAKLPRYKRKVLVAQEKLTKDSLRKEQVAKAQTGAATAQQKGSARVASAEEKAADARRKGSDQIAELASGFGPEGMAAGAGIKIARNFEEAHPFLSRFTGMHHLNKLVDKISGANKSTTKQKINIAMQKGKKPVIVIAAIIFIILIVGAGFLFSGDAGAKMAGDTVRRFIQYFAEEEYWQTLNNFGGMFKGMIDWARGQFDRQIEIATTGDIFNGKVDEYATQKLGLNLEVDDQRVASEDRQPLIKTGGKVRNAFITGGISGRGLNQDICNAVNVECDLDQISLSCFTNRNEPGEMVPSILDFKYIENQHVGTSCNFDELTVGNDKARTIFMKAEFDFIAAGSIIKQMVSKDKFDELYKLDHEFETGRARYTPGPVSTKMLDTFVKRKVLIAAPEIPVRWGVEFENVGEGTIDHFERITIMLPEGVEVRACNPPMDGTNPITLDYEKDQSYLKFTKNRNMEAGNRMKITCDLIITPNALYLADDITLDFFQVLAEYKYRIQKGVKFGIQEFEQIIPIYDDDITLRNAETCECKIRVPGKEDESTKLLEKGENCGSTHKDIATKCKEKEKSECENSNNQCDWINDRYGCRIETFEI